MSSIRYDLVWAALNKSRVLIADVGNDIHKRFISRKKILLYDESLTDDERTEAIKMIKKTYDRDKVREKSGNKRTCENCNQECFATLFCEFCVRNHLKTNFPNWSSGNDNIDNLIKKCQMDTLEPNRIVEWIPYKNLENIKYLTEGGFSKIYTADWIYGRYDEWDSEKKQLERIKTHKVVLKALGSIENANQNWFEEVCIQRKSSKKLIAKILSSVIYEVCKKLLFCRLKCI
jgi:hypothetical protein